MIYRQDFKKLFVRAGFIFGSFATFLVYGLTFNVIEFELQDSLFLAFAVLFPTLWCLSYLWYFFRTTDNELIKQIFGKVKSIQIQDITELSYEDNPARPLVYITFKKPGGGEDYIEFTTGVWSPHTLLTLNQELQQKNPNIKIKFDEKTKKDFEKDKDYHLNHPKNLFGWIVLGIKQMLWGILLAGVLVLIKETL